jgi:hypothetical protein
VKVPVADTGGKQRGNISAGKRARHVEPSLGAESFSCAHCGAYAHQDWFQLYLSKVETESRPIVLRPDVLAPIVEKGPSSHDDDEEIHKKIADLFERLKKHEVTYSAENSTAYLNSSLVNVAASRCYSCGGFTLWVEDRIVYPRHTAEVAPHEDMPGDVKADFLEAAPRSPHALPQRANFSASLWEFATGPLYPPFARKRTRWAIYEYTS